MGVFGTAKPLASLSSGLLARKGQARPAMRPQGFATLAPDVAGLDDLGWNDMGGTGTDAPVPVQQEEVPPPPVLAERATLAREIAASIPDAQAISLATATRIGRESAAQTLRGKAAFTLRLDPDRHLRLRLASAVSNRSAQALVAEALDVFIAAMPQVEALAMQLPRSEFSR